MTIRTIEKLIEKLKKPLHLTEWRIHVAQATKDAKENILADITVMSQYAEAEVKIYPMFFKVPHADQERTILHEMCHIPTEPYKDMWQDMANGKFVPPEHEARLNERLTSYVAHIIEPFVLKK